MFRKITVDQCGTQKISGNLNQTLVLFFLNKKPEFLRYFANVNLKENIKYLNDVAI